MALRVAAARAIEGDALVGPKPMFGGAERMLPRQKQTQLQATAAKRGGDRCKFDRFWTGSDDEVDTRTGQPSP